MLHVAALTSGKNDPSTRFRLRQHIASLQQYGIAVHEYFPIIDKNVPLPFWPEHISPRYVLPYYLLWQAVKIATRIPGILGSCHRDIAVTWLQRQLLPGYLTLERKIKTPLVFDVDDSIWHVGRFGVRSVRATARHSEITIVGNTFLADWFADCARTIHIVPTAIDTERFHPRAPDDRRGKFVIGWTGTKWNLPFLQAIERPLKCFLDAHKEAELLIVSHYSPTFSLLPPDRVRFVRWSEEVEASSVQQMDVGLMPLPDNEWTRGKCSCKMLQYMACGLPTIVSPVGMNADILAMDAVGLPATQEADWVDALEFFYSDPARAGAYGRAGRTVVEHHFSQKQVAAQLADILSTFQTVRSQRSALL